MVHIIPTILVKTFKEFKKTVKKIENDFPLAQIDVMDGEFVPNTSFFNWHEILEIQTPLKYELHLMVEDPRGYIKKLPVTSYQLPVKKIFFHYESRGDIKKTISAVKESGLQVGLVINPDTPVRKIQEHIAQLDCLMLMGVHPGFSGQNFLSQTIERVREARKLSKDISIEVDGGVNADTAKPLVKAGADILAVGSFLYKDEPKKQREKILKAIHQ